MHRAAEISIALDGRYFKLERLESAERLSELFTIIVDGFSRDEFDFLEHLGKPVGLTIGEEGQPIRHFHGLLIAAELTHIDGSGLHYRLTLRPWFYLLDQNLEYRIFQDATVVEIAKKIFDKCGMKDYNSDKLKGAYVKRDYCVQYKETDFSFISRLFEEEGIYYFFEHEKAAHKLILCDDKSAHAEADGYGKVRLIPIEGANSGVQDTFWEWQDRVSTGGQASVAVRSFDFTKPSSPVDFSHKGELQHPKDVGEIYAYEGDSEDRTFGQTRGQIRLEEARAPRRVCNGVGDVPGLACGGVFTLSSQSVDRFNDDYLITGLRFELKTEGYRSGSEGESQRTYVEAIPKSTPFRPPLKTPRPTASGPETATVTGPDGQEIWIDDFGRVKVRFHWDRRPDDPGKTTFWIRVSQGAAGNGFGMVNVPRVGQEVIVDFLQGDPDRPIITGHVYDGDRKHPYAAKDERTKTVWKTRTVGDPGDYGGAENQPPSTPGFNELRLEDKGGSEELYVHAQRMMVTEVLLDDKLTVQRDRITRVGRDRTTEIKHDEKLTVEEGDETHTVSKGKRVTEIKMNDELTVDQGDQKTTVSQGNVSTTVSMGNVDTKVSMGNFTVKVDLGQVTVEAMQSITLKVGQSSVVIDQMGVTVKGMMVTSEAQLMQKVKGVMTQVEGSAMTMVKGGIVMIN